MNTPDRESKALLIIALIVAAASTASIWYGGKALVESVEAAYVAQSDR